MKPPVELMVFDVGGSHIAGGLCESEHLQLTGKSSAPVDCNGNEESFFAAVERVASRVLDEGNCDMDEVGGMSFAFPGPFDYAQGVSRLTHKFASLNGKSVRDELAKRFEFEPSRIRFLNDADAFLLGELTQLPAANHGKTVGITLGTGVGSAFAIEGAIVHSGTGVPQAGEVWNLPWGEGIVEDAISTRGIQGIYEKRTGRKPSVHEIAEACPADVHAAKTFEEFGETLGTVMRAVTAEFRPSTVIFGGAISRSASLFLPFAARQFGGSKTLQVSLLFEDAALYGAAAHWVRSQRNWRG